MKLYVFTQPEPPEAFSVPPVSPPGPAFRSPGFPVPGPAWPGWPVLPEQLPSVRPRERLPHAPWPIED